MNLKKLWIVLILLTSIIIGIFIRNQMINKELHSEEFDQSAFYLGKWNGQYSLNGEEAAIINFIAITTEEQAEYLIKIEDSLHLDTEDLTTSEVKVKLGDNVDYKDKNFRLINLETTFNASDLLKLNRAIKKIELREDNKVLVQKDIGEVNFLVGNEKNQSPFTYNGYNVAYPTLDKLKLEFINNTKEKIEINNVLIENTDLDFEILSDLPINAKPGEEIILEILLKPLNESNYDFWIISPKIEFDSNQAYLPSTYHYNYEINKKTIETIIERN